MVTYEKTVPYNSTADQSHDPIATGIFLTIAVAICILTQYGYLLKSFMTTYILDRYSTMNVSSRRADIVLNSIISVWFLVITLYILTWSEYISNILGSFQACTGCWRGFQITNQDVMALVLSSISMVVLFFFWVCRVLYYLEWADNRNPTAVSSHSQSFVIIGGKAWPILSLVCMILFMGSWNWVRAELPTVKPFPGGLFGSFGTLTLASGILLVLALVWTYSYPAFAVKWQLDAINVEIEAEKSTPKQAEMEKRFDQVSVLTYRVPFLNKWLFVPYLGTSEAVFGFADPNLLEIRKNLPLKSYGNTIMGYIEEIYLPWYWITSYSFWWFPVSCMTYGDPFKALMAALICAWLPWLFSVMARSTYHYLSFHFAAVFFFHTLIYLLEFMQPPPASTVGGDDASFLFQKAIDLNFMTTRASVNGTSTQATTVSVSYWITILTCGMTFASMVMRKPFKEGTHDLSVAPGDFVSNF